MKGVLSDIRHTARLHGRTPLASTIAILTLAASFAFVSTFLSIWSDLRLKSHPGFHDSGRLVSFGQTKGARVLPVNMRFVSDADTTVSGLDGAAGVLSTALRMEADDHEELLVSELVSPAYFPVLRPRLALGRGFVEADHHPTSEPVVIISYDYWQYRFAGDPSVIGQTLMMNGPSWASAEMLGAESNRLFRIVGVMASGMNGTFSSHTQQWLPFERAIGSVYPGMSGDFSTMSALLAVGRLKDGTGLSALRRELRAHYESGAASELELREDYRIDATGGLVTNIAHHRDAERHVRLALVSAMLVLVVASFNLGLFLLAQAPGRRRELGVRLAVGASFPRLVRQLATEAVVVAVVAAALGTMLALWLTAFAQDLAVLRNVSVSGASPLDWRVLLMIAALTAVLAFAASLAPMGALRRMSIAAGSRDTASGGTIHRIVGSVQVACATALACAALAIVTHLVGLQKQDPGFDAQGLVVVRGAPIRAGINDWPRTTSEREWRRTMLLENPSIEDVAFGNPVPGDPILFATHVNSPSVHHVDFRALVVSADSRFPEMLGMHLVRGRMPERDEPDAILVNTSLADAFWGRIDVEGEVVTISAQDVGGSPRQSRVVGVLRDASFAHPGVRVEPMVFSPLVSSTSNDVAIVRTRLSAMELQQGLLDLGNHATQGYPVSHVESVAEVWDRLLADDRARALVSSTAAILVLALSMIGFHGTVHYLINARRREYAIRTALGASPGAIRKLVLVRGIVMGLPGLAAGSLIGWILIETLRGSVVSGDVSTLKVTAVVAAVMTSLLVAANLGPAARASSVSPSRVLRED